MSVISCFSLRSILPIFIITGYCAIAQPYYTAEEAIKAFPNDKVIILRQSEEMTVSFKKNLPVVKSKKFVQTLYLSDKLVMSNQRDIGYKTGFETIDDIQGCLYRPQDKKYSKEKVLKIKKVDHLDDAIFYDGENEFQITYPPITSGCVSELSYTKNVEDLHFLGSYFFKYSHSVMSSAFVLRYPKKVHLKMLLFGDTTGIRYKSYEDGDEIVCKWEGEKLPEMPYFQDAPYVRSYEPHIFVLLQSYDTPKGVVNVSGSLKDLYKKEYSYLLNVNNPAPDKTLKHIVDSLKTSFPSRPDFIKAVYYWVQDNMKYIAFEDGIGSFRPREANDVFIKKYGDCKDLANLIKYMLELGDVTSYLSWLGTRDLPYTFEQLPSMSCSNHMITSVFDNNRWIYLDGTLKNGRFKHPAMEIQGKDIMISVSPDSFLVNKIPVLEVKENVYSDSLVLSIQKNNLTGAGYSSFNGFYRTWLLDKLYYTDPNKRKDDWKDFLKLGNNKCTITNYSILNENDKDKELIANYSFAIPDYLRNIDNDWFINIHLRQNFSHLKADTGKNRKTDKYYKFLFQEKFSRTLIVPPGFKVKKLPESFSIAFDKLHYSISYEIRNNAVLMNERMVYDDMKVPNAKFDEWNDAIDRISNQYKELIILTKTTL